MNLTASRSNQLFSFGRSKPKPATIPSDQCEVCGKRDSMKSCSRCHSVTYCGRECQVAHWKYHKIYCSEIPEQKKNTEFSGNSEKTQGNSDGGAIATATRWNLFGLLKNSHDPREDSEETYSDSDSQSDSSRTDNQTPSSGMIVFGDWDLLHMNNFPKIYDSQNKPVAVNIVMAKYKAVLSSCCATGWRLRLLDGPNGWMAPRMHQLLMYTAVYLSSDGDFMMKECPHLHFGLFGFQYILKKISEIMEVSSHIPTAGFIHEYLFDDAEWEYGGPAKEFFQRGGRIEHVIDYLCRAAMEFVKEGELQGILDNEEASLPTTPLDYEFDLVRVMCLGRECFDSKTTIEHLFSSK